MTAQSSILAWEIQWTEEPGGLQPMGVSKSQPWQQLNNSNNIFAYHVFFFFSVVSSFFPLLLPFNLENFL